MDKTINELEKERSELYDKIHSVDSEIRKKKFEALNLDLEDKYIKYVDTFETTHFVHVRYVTEDRFYCSTHNIDYAYLITGHGFDGEFTGYDDATDFYWSYWYELRISSMDADTIIREINKIEIITKEEFDTEFDKCVLNLIEHKNRYENDNRV